MKTDTLGDDVSEFENPSITTPVCMTTRDKEEVSALVSAKFGKYPVDGPWGQPRDRWPGIMTERIASMVEANESIYQYFKENYGEGSDQAIITGIVLSLTPEICAIAGSQLTEGYHGPRSWKDTNLNSSDFLTQKINLILENEDYEKFFTKNPSSKLALMMIRDVFIPSSDPDLMFKAHSEYMDQCIKDNADGKVVLYVPFNSDFIQPVENEDQKTEFAEAGMMAFFPLDSQKRSDIGRVSAMTWKRLSENPKALPTSPLHLFIGETASSAGMEVLSQTVGEAFLYKKGEEKVRGFFYALNLNKKIGYWDLMGKVMDLPESVQAEDMSPYFSLLYVPHEQAHALFRIYKLFGEAPADMAAVIQSMNVYEELGLDRRQLIRAFLTEYVSEIVNSSSGGELYEGYREGSGMDELSAAYFLSGVLITNQLFSDGVITFDGKKLHMNNDGAEVENFLQNLTKLENLFHSGDEETLNTIKRAVLTNDAREFVEFCRKNIKVENSMVEGH